MKIFQTCPQYNAGLPNSSKTKHYILLNYKHLVLISFTVMSATSTGKKSFWDNHLTSHPIMLRMCYLCCTVLWHRDNSKIT